MIRKTVAILMLLLAAATVLFPGTGDSMSEAEREPRERLDLARDVPA
jgi:hypothetical protein